MFATVIDNCCTTATLANSINYNRYLVANSHYPVLFLKEHDNFKSTSDDPNEQTDTPQRSHVQWATAMESSVQQHYLPPRLQRMRSIQAELESPQFSSNQMLSVKKTMVQGLMVFAFLSANVSQLRSVMNSSSNFRDVNLVMISLSIFFQVHSPPGCT